MSDIKYYEDYDLSNYFGKKKDTYNDGILVDSYDTREVEPEKAKKIQRFSKTVSKECDENAPWYNQVNALNKQLNPTSTRMTAEEAISVTRYVDNKLNKYYEKSNEVIACNNLREIDAITWDD